MEESKRVICSCSSSLVVSLLIITLPLVYFAFFQIDDQWKPYFLQGDVEKGKKPLQFLLRRLMRGEKREELEKTGFACISELYSDQCVSSKEVRFDTNSSRVFIHSNQELRKFKVRPYVLLKNYGELKRPVTPVEIQNGDVNPQPCDYVHDEPVVVFSSGGFVGNTYHEMNDVIIPLFITSRHFRSRVKFMVTDFSLEFISKYKNIFKGLSRYEVINAVETATRTVHCFPGAVVGLKFHGFLSLNKSDIPGGYSMFEFRDFLTESYHVTVKNVSGVVMGSEKPKLLLISRTETRTLLNQDEVVKMMEDLGFQVVISTVKMMSNLEGFIRIINSCSVMVGVHGAGLTNELFLPNGAVTIQVVPISLEWAGAYYFGAPAKTMGLQYLEYKIEPQESSLFEMYGPDHPVITDPKSIEAQGFPGYKAIYLDNQNVKINVERFRKTLVEAFSVIQSGIM